MANEKISILELFFWYGAGIIGRDFRVFQYINLILPLVVLHRLDCRLKGSKDTVLESAKNFCKQGIIKRDNVSGLLNNV